MTACKCPYCGARLELNITAPSKPAAQRGMALFQSAQKSVFGNAAAPAFSSLPVGFTAERQSPAGFPTRESQVVVPLLESLITGVFVGLSVAPFVMYRYGFWTGLAWGGISFLGASFVQWIRLTGNYRNLLWKLETITGQDLDGSGGVGEPLPPAPPIRVEVQEGQSLKFADLPGDRSALVEFARKVNDGIVTFSESGARRAGYGATEFGRLRDVFISRHWAYWNHPTQRQQGVTLRGSGRAILAQLAAPLPFSSVPGRESRGTVARGGTHAQDDGLSEKYIPIGK